MSITGNFGKPVIVAAVKVVRAAVKKLKNFRKTGRPIRAAVGRMTRPVRAAALAVLLVVLSMAMLSSCATVPAVDAPEGFAGYDRQSDFLAVSPEGVRFKVRYEKNEPKQDLEFWKEALEIHMDGSGYEKLSGDTFKTADGEGVYFEWVAPVGQEDWIYLTAVMVHDEWIAVAEAAGSFPVYKKYRDRLMKSLKTISRPD
ncbi:MAG: hypothetical protein SVR04_08180 [Spirochaetota bacterium]|nr:hypothetical protein [Spirochaetota bacterium]